MANSGTSILVDSDSEEELNRKAIGSRKRRLSSCVPDDSERAEEVSFCCQTMAIFKKIFFEIYSLMQFCSILFLFSKEQQ